MQLSIEQERIVNSLMFQIIDSGYGYRPHTSDSFSASVCGYAGTGKTTMISELRRRIAGELKGISVAFVTFTGKASSVLRQKLIDNDAYFSSDYVGTIHGLIYKAETIYDPNLKCNIVIDWTRKDRYEVPYNLIIIDEASMVSKEIWNDLLYYEKTIIAVGDHGQLPPIGGKFNLLENPDFELKEIQRQALDSPIIKLSKFVRENGYIPSNKFFSREVFKLDWRSEQCQKIWNSVNFDDDLVVLCAFNTTRANINDMIREKLCHGETLPYPGEKLVCLQNNHNIKIMNGQIGKLRWVMPMDYKLHRMTIEIDEQVYECLVSPKCFGQVSYTMHDASKELKRQRKYGMKQGFQSIDFFDYGYCISVHKSQGSEWQKVIVFEQRTKKWDDEYYSKWLYTAITRAKEKLFIISNAWI